MGATICFFALPKVDTGTLRVVRAGSSTARNNAFNLSMAFADEMGDSNVVADVVDSPRPLSVDELHRLYEATARDWGKMWSERYSLRPLTNLFPGEPIRFEASPGNLVLRPAAASSYELVWHDLDGAEAITNTVTPTRWVR